MKYALVTGGSRGIGRAICHKLAQQGYKVIINYVSNENEAYNTLQDIKDEGGDAEILQFNVADRTGSADAIAQWQ